MNGLHPAPIRMYLRARNFINQAMVFGAGEPIRTLYTSVQDDSHFGLYQAEITAAYQALKNSR